MDSVSGNSWFATIYLTKGYYLMNSDLSYKKYLAFKTPLKNKFESLVYGYKDSRAVFHFLKDLVLGDLQPETR